MRWPPSRPGALLAVEFEQQRDPRPRLLQRGPQRLTFGVRQITSHDELAQLEDVVLGILAAALLCRSMFISASRGCCRDQEATRKRRRTTQVSAAPASDKPIASDHGMERAVTPATTAPAAMASRKGGLPTGAWRPKALATPSSIRSHASSISAIAWATSRLPAASEGAGVRGGRPGRRLSLRTMVRARSSNPSSAAWSSGCAPAMYPVDDGGPRGSGRPSSKLWRHTGETR